jgi:unsaturated rhamnogalacturonyl hydrolase
MTRERPAAAAASSRDSGRHSRLLTRAADVLMAHPFACWHYGDSVGFEGLLAASDLLGDPRYAAFAHGFMRAWAARAEPYRELDNTAPGHALCLAYERTGDELLLDAATALARFLMARPTVAGVYTAFARAPLREPYDGSPLCDAEAALLADPGPGVFVDCLHFDPPFLVHLGRLTGDEELLDAGAAQALAAVELLQDPDSGIFHHFYLPRADRRFGYGWSRGQGWALLGLVDVLERLPGDHPAAAPLGAALRALAGALAATQEESGHWPARVHEADAFLETSAALFVATGFGRAVRLGLLERELRTTAERAYRAGLRAVGDDGVLEGVSVAVWASTAPGHYRAVPTGGAVAWGQGPLLLAAAELDRGSA